MKSHRPLVSVIMNCYNGAKYLQEAISSVYSQTYSNWEIVFWDNNSTDESSVIAKGYDSKLRYFKASLTESLGIARKRAVEEARGEYIAFLDTDDLWTKSKLQIQIRAFIEHPEWVVIYSNCQPIDENGKKVGSRTIPQYYSGNVFDHLLIGKLTPPWPTTMIRAKELKDIGSFRAYSSAEDKDIFLRLADKYEYGFTKDMLAYYRMHPNQESKNHLTSLNESVLIYQYWYDKYQGSFAQREKLLSIALSNAYYKSAVYSLSSSIPKKEMSNYIYKSLKHKLQIKNILVSMLLILPRKMIYTILLLIRKVFGRGAVLFYYHK